MSNVFGVFSIPRTLTDKAFTPCAKHGFYDYSTKEKTKASTALDLLAALRDPDDLDDVLEGMDEELIERFKEAGAVCETIGGKQFVVVSMPITAEAVFEFLGGGLLGDRIVTVIIVNKFNAPLKLERSTWDKGSSSGHEDGHPAVFQVQTSSYVKHREIPASRKNDRRGTQFDGVGLFRFKRNKFGGYGCEGGLHFSCADPAASNGVTVAFKNELGGLCDYSSADLTPDSSVAVSVNSRDLDAFKVKFVDNVGSLRHAQSQNEDAQIHGSNFKAHMCLTPNMQGGEDIDGRPTPHMLITVVAGPK